MARWHTDPPIRKTRTIATAIGTREDNRNVVYWLRDSLHTHREPSEKGETDGNATSIARKVASDAHRNRPRMMTMNIPADSHKHRYLEREDGTPISSWISVYWATRLASTG